MSSRAELTSLKMAVSLDLIMPVILVGFDVGPRYIVLKAELTS
jgi:hypothetical protein